jgi:hypothetical protein
MPGAPRAGSPGMLTTLGPEREGALAGIPIRNRVRYRGPASRDARYVRLITSVKMSACPSGGPSEFLPSVHTGYSSDPPRAIAL